MHIIESSYQVNQFSMIALASRMDGAIFVRESKAFEIVKGTPSSEKDFLMLFFKQYERNFKRYEQIQKSRYSTLQELDH